MVKLLSQQLTIKKLARLKQVKQKKLVKIELLKSVERLTELKKLQKRFHLKLKLERTHHLKKANGNMLLMIKEMN